MCTLKVNLSIWLHASLLADVAAFQNSWIYVDHNGIATGGLQELQISCQGTNWPWGCPIHDSEVVTL